MKSSCALQQPRPAKRRRRRSPTGLACSAAAPLAGAPLPVASPLSAPPPAAPPLASLAWPGCAFCGALPCGPRAVTPPATARPSTAASPPIGGAAQQLVLRCRLPRRPTPQWAPCGGRPSGGRSSSGFACLARRPTSALDAGHPAAAPSTAPSTWRGSSHPSRRDHAAAARSSRVCSSSNHPFVSVPWTASPSTLASTALRLAPVLVLLLVPPPLALQLTTARRRHWPRPRRPLPRRRQSRRRGLRAAPRPRGRQASPRGVARGHSCRHPPLVSAPTACNLR